MPKYDIEQKATFQVSQTDRPWQAEMAIEPIPYVVSQGSGCAKL